MHPALQNYDILLGLFGFLDHNGEGGDRFKDCVASDRYRVDRWALLQAASTCRAFCDPALAILWESIDSLLPLFLLLKPFIYDGERYRLTGEIDDDDRAKVARYGRRVRSLVTDGKIALEDACTQLVAPANEPLLPGLKHLHILIDANTSLAELNLVVGPSLRTLRIQNAQGYNAASRENRSHDFVDPFLTTMVSTNPTRLRSLQLDIGLNQWWMYHLLSELDLQHLILTEPVHAEFFSTTVLGLTDLTSLSVVIEDGTNPKELFPSSSPQHGTFHDLRSLDVYADPTCLLSVVRKVDAPALRQLNIGSSEDSYSSSWWEDCYSMVSRRWRRQVKVSGFAGERS